MSTPTNPTRPDVRGDLADGSWERRHGELRELAAYDAGLRLVVSRA